MNMKTVAVVLAGVFVCGFPAASRAVAGVNVNINVNVPPPLVIAAPPPLFVIPGTYVYFAPDVDVDIIFYQGYWYRPYRGGWYRSDHYNGRWVVIPVNRVPVVLTKLPPHWKNVPPGHQRIPYGQVKQNWRTWERDKHWDKPEKQKGMQKQKRRGGDNDDRERGRGKGRGGKHD